MMLFQMQKLHSIKAGTNITSGTDPEVDSWKQILMAFVKVVFHHLSGTNEENQVLQLG
jgi:hypothetical protein